MNSLPEYEKWNKYTTGNVAFINNRRGHPCRKVFTDYVRERNIKSIIEVGAGEMIEYQSLKDIPDLKYTVVDVSDVFLSNCKEKHPKVIRIQAPYEEFKSPECELIYGCGVLEHSRDIREGLANLIQSSEEFFFTMFKWSYSKNNGLKSHYDKRKYWTTSFTIGALLREVEKHGEITSTNMCMKDTGELIDFDTYSKNKSGHHRTGDRLIIQGKRR
jgi:hypothetical protein